MKRNYNVGRPAAAEDTMECDLTLLIDVKPCLQVTQIFCSCLYSAH